MMPTDKMSIILVFCGLLAIFPSRVSAQPVPLRGFVSLSGGYQVTTHDFDDVATFRENLEDGQFRAEYPIDTGPAFDVAGGVMVWKQLGIAVGVSRFTRDSGASVSTEIPHPFLFQQPRSIGLEVGGVRREELAIHLQARALILSGTRLQVMFFGGPSFFRVKQPMVTDFTYGELYPYDEVTSLDLETRTANESAVGFNVGGDIAFFFVRQVGVGLGGHFASASVDIPAFFGASRKVDVGGLQINGGLRVRF